MNKVDELAKQLGLKAGTRNRQSFKMRDAGAVKISVQVHIEDAATGETVQDLDLKDSTQVILLVGTPHEENGEAGTALGGLMLCGPDFLQHSIEHLRDSHMKAMIKSMASDPDQFEKLVGMMLAAMDNGKGPKQ